MSKYKLTTVALDHRPAQKKILLEIAEERDRQDEKWGRDFNGRTHSFWLTILMEEIGEAAEAILEAPHTGDYGHIHEELIQSAAVIVSWLEFFDEAIAGDIRVA